MTFHDVSQLPATAVPEEALTDAPLADPQVGDIVVVYSRGANRLAQVTKTGPKRVEVIYTTKGAWTTAQGIYETYLARSPEAEARRAAEQAGKNYDYTVDCTTEEYQAQQQVRWSHITPERAERDRQKAIADLAGYGTRDEYTALKGDEARVKAERDRDVARQFGPDCYVHVTTKSVKREQVFGLAAKEAA